MPCDPLWTTFTPQELRSWPASAHSLPQVLGFLARFFDGTAIAYKARMSLQAGARSWRTLPMNERLRCVVVESGAGRLTQADGFDETVVVAQMRGEPPLAFAQRVIDRIAIVERSGRRFEAATVLAGDRYDRATKAARRLVMLAISNHARARGGMSELTLASVPEAEPERSAELLGLAEELMTLPNANSVPVRVRFGAGSAEGQRPSGIFPTFGVKR